ncbi:diguanylate cyclase (GGDEF)-like protein [Kineococcus xinjiangensis]|uniref:Diguanylate cyclase (GGDEF)-like protein n=1 Tax=Kineococcus xinjiangensis TaxID=512762 RepID=A0A2S6IFV8_9ACTN|nr:bifunctional diguanylate cyclase/phosphodiesterase [Kineococcus xinjiangensis]PPK93099.1 diguanylate cyclase (GGDEF)-like protein [Kineococcus xinjiangensis]
MTAPSAAPPRPRGRWSLPLLVAAALTAPGLAAVLDPAFLATPFPWIPFLAFSGATTLLLTTQDPADPRRRYGRVSLTWGAGHLVAALLLLSGVGGPQASIAVLAATFAGVIVLMQSGLRRIAAPGSIPTLLIDASMLGAALSVVTWHVLSAVGAVDGGTGLRLAVLALLLGATHVTARGIHAAIDDPRMRAPGIALAACALGELPALYAILTGDLRIGWVGALLVLAGTAVAGVFSPHRRTGLRSVADGALAEHRREIASLIPGPLLLADLAWLIADPGSTTRALLLLYALTLVLYAVRHYEAARAYLAVAGDLRTQALLDRGTGLGNRLALTETLRQVSTSERSVLLVAVEGLDNVRDVLGLSAGDAVLAAVGRRLEAAAPCGGAYRSGDEEFAVLLTGGTDEARALAPALLDAVRSAPAQVPAAARFDLDATIGLASTSGRRSPDAPDSERLAVLTDAALALRGARSGGSGTVAAFDGAIADANRRRLLVRERLALALAAGTLDVHFQPVVDLDTGGVASFEALARWTDDVLGRVNPVEFITVAEEANLVVALGQHVLAAAVRTAADAGVFAAGASLAVNVSVVQLHAPGFADAVRAVLTDVGVPASQLTLEVTESVFLDTGSPAERVLRELADTGVRIAIDDFGAGHASFGYLGRFPAHVLKIDRSLTNTLTVDSDGQVIVSCIVELATQLGMVVVVEGIETAEQAVICSALGAQRGQGWLFEAAVPTERLAEQLDRNFASGGVPA